MLRREEAITADRPPDKPITAAELKKLKEALEELAGLSDPREARSFAEWVRELAKWADAMGGIERMAECAEAYNELVPGKG